MDKPVILLPNHRSAFMDPIALATQLKRTSYFLVRGESFNKPLAIKLFKRLKMIPIFRKEYNPEKTHQNEDIFRYCHNLMEENGCLMIFPEGVCQTKYLLAPVKTGTARIALGAEHKHNFNLDVHLIPIGINYSNPHRFRGKLTLNIGEPIKMKPYQQLYEEDNWKGIEKLTSDIETQLRSLIITFEDQSQIDVVVQIENLNKGNRDETDLSQRDWFGQRQAVSDLVVYYDSRGSKDFENFKIDLKRYSRSLTWLGVKNSFDPDGGKRLNKTIGFRTIMLLIGLPVFVLGFLLHILPFMITRVLSLKLVKRVDFMGSVVLVLGSLVFAIFGFGQTGLVYRLTDSYMNALVFLLLWPSLGLFVYTYSAYAVKWRDHVRWILIGWQRKKLQVKLKSDKKDMLARLSTLYSQYRQETEKPPQSATNS